MAVHPYLDIVPGKDGPMIRYTAYEFNPGGSPVLLDDGVTWRRSQRKSPLLVELPSDLGGRL